MSQPAARTHVDPTAADAVDVAVIIVNFNTGDLLPDCLEAYQRQDYPRLELIVVDNASSDGSGDLIDMLATRTATWRHPTRFVRNRTNRGFCGGINDGLAHTDAQVVVFSNVDVAPAPDLIAIAVETLLAHPRRGSVQPLLTRPPGGPLAATIDSAGHQIDRARMVANRAEGASPDQAPPAGEVFGVSGALAVHRREMLNDVAWSTPDGPQVLTEDLFAFFDDVELDWRARLLGWHAWFEPAARAVHERGGSGSRRTRRVEALNFANRLLVIATCDGGRRWIINAPLVFATTGLKAIELLVTHPIAWIQALWMVATGMPATLRRRRDLASRIVVARGDVVRHWTRPFTARSWVSGWWRRSRHARGQVSRSR